MIKTAGNRVFARLSSILNLPGTENLGKIDIGVAQPTYPLREVVEAELIIPGMLTYTFTLGPGATTIDFPFDPFEADIGGADSRQIFVSQARQNQPVIVAGTTVVDRDFDVYLVDFGITFDAATVGAATCTLYQEFSAAISPPTPPNIIRVLASYSGNRTLGGENAVLPQTQRMTRRPFPFRLPSEAYVNGDTDRLAVNANASPAGAEEGVAAGRIVIVRKGVLPTFI